MHVGDSIDLSVIDRDAFDDDLIARGKFEVPKELAQSGFGIFSMKLGSTSLFLAVSATDGKRLCSGVEGDVSQVKIDVPSKVVTRVDADAFGAIKANNKCNLNGSTPACAASSYVAAYVDVNEDGTPDVIATGGPFAKGSTSKVVGLWLGVDPSTRKQIFLGDCDDLGLLSKTEFTCTAFGKTTVVSYAGKGSIRQASAAEVSKSQSLTAEERSREASVQLKVLYVEQTSFKENGSLLDQFPGHFGRGKAEPLCILPCAERRDTAPPRDGVAVSPLSYSIVSPDENAFPGIAVPTGLKDSGCPLTFGTSADGEPIGLGVTGEAPDQEFIAYAIGNVDDDADFDCWSIASMDRVAKSGRRFPAGQPWHEKSDFAESKATASATDL